MNNILHDEIVDSAVFEIADLQVKYSELERLNKILVHELQCCKHSFEHHSLDGHAWIVDQVLIMVGEV